jgi:DNA-binding NarL/FixJ family response regulator
MHGVTAGGVPVCGANCDVVALCRLGKSPRRFDMIARRADGTEVPVDVTTITIRDAEPIAVHVLLELEPARTARVPELEARRRIDESLTPRETAVLRLLASGADTEEIARTLSVASTTVRNHIQNLLPKLGVHSRVDAVVMALRAGIVETP